eukprot:13015064-Alexandrium_andersonii.AAC.1
MIRSSGKEGTPVQNMQNRAERWTSESAGGELLVVWPHCFRDEKPEGLVPREAPRAAWKRGGGLELGRFAGSPGNSFHVLGRQL